MAPALLAGLTVAGLPAQLRHWQPAARYLLSEKRAYPRAELEGLGAGRGIRPVPIV